MSDGTYVCISMQSSDIQQLYDLKCVSDTHEGVKLVTFKSFTKPILIHVLISISEAGRYSYIGYVSESLGSVLTTSNNWGWNNVECMDLPTFLNRTALYKLSGDPSVYRQR